MKKLYLMLLLATLCAGFGFAQVTPTGAVQGIPNQAGILYASNFGQWQVPPGNLGQYSWKQSSFCYVGIPTGNPVLTMPAFTVGTPIEIVDTDNFCDGVTITNTTATTFHDIIYAYSKAAYFADLTDNGGGYLTSGSGATAAVSGYIKVKINGTDAYIRVYAAAN